MEQDITQFNTILNLLGTSIQDVIIDSIILIITIVSYIVLLVSIVKLYKIGTIPGSGKLLTFIIGVVIMFLLSLIYLYVYEDYESSTLDQAIEVTYALITAVGAYGFFELTRHIKNANK